MKKSIEIISMIMVFALVLGLLTACGNKVNTESGKQEASQSGENITSDTAATLDTSKEVEIILYLMGGEAPKGKELLDNFNKLAKEKLNCTLKINYISWSNYTNEYPLLFSSGEKFDLAYTGSWLNFSSLAQKGAFMPLDDKFEQYAPKTYAKMTESSLRQATVDGHIYCVPTTYLTYSAWGPVYRTDFLDGVDWSGEIRDFETFEEYLDLVKENTTMEPLEIYSSGSEVDDLFLHSNGMRSAKGAMTDNLLWFNPSEENPKMISIADYEKTPEFLDMMKRWNEKGFFPKSALSDTDANKMSNGKAACFLKNPDSYVGVVVNHPEWNVKYASLTSDIAHLPATQDALVVSNTSENPERALALYDYITSDKEAYDAFYYGIKGISYDIIDNQVKMLDVDNYAESALWTARTKEFKYDIVGTPADFRSMLDGFEAKIKEGQGAEKYTAFVLNTDPVVTEYSACMNVHQQYWWPLELGYTDTIAGLAEYKEKLKVAGIDKVQAEFQKQLDEYVASLK